MALNQSVDWILSDFRNLKRIWDSTDSLSIVAQQQTKPDNWGGGGRRFKSCRSDQNLHSENTLDKASEEHQSELALVQKTSE